MGRGLARSTVTLLALMLVGIAWADEDPSPNGGNLFKRFAIDQKLLVTDWFAVEARRPSFTIPLALGWTGAVFGDERTVGLDLKGERWFEHESMGSTHGMWEGFTRLGDAGPALAITGATWLTARWTGHTHLQHTTSLAAEGMLNAAVDSTILKMITRRPRPAAGGTGDFFVQQLEPGQSADSFPSGHTMGAFAVATVFARSYAGHRAVPWLAYGGATMIGLSRIALGRHFPSDVLVGAVLGHSLGALVVARDRGEFGSRKPLEIEPLFPTEEHGPGIAYRHTW
jgi:membrane-associated phospholipid phosphatase